jgi:biopolymer transport protein ExbD
MVRIPPGSRERTHDIDSTMTPMIDVVFLLLIFFVWTTGTQIVEYLLPGNLSAPAGTAEVAEIDPPPDVDFDKVVIRLRWDGNLPDWTINDQPTGSLKDVVETLQALAKIKQDAPIIIHPDDNVPLGHVVEVLDESRLAGFLKVSFAVRPLQN